MEPDPGNAGEGRLEIPDIIVLGGGIIGTSIAWRAATRGISVTLIDPDDSSAASGVAAGMLAPVTEAHFGEEDLVTLNLASATAYPEFVAEIEEATGMSCGYEECGTLMVARDRDDAEALEQLLAFQAELGLKSERLSGPQIRELEPTLARNVRGGSVAPDDHQVDPPRLLNALKTACRDAGVTQVMTKAIAVRADGDRVAGVTLVDGTNLAGDTVVVATGASSSKIELPDGISLPVRPVKGQLVHLRLPPGQIHARNVRGFDVYLVIRAGGEIVVGATVEEITDPEPTAGAVFELLRAVYELLPGITEATFVRTGVGFRPATPDNAPLIGTIGPSGLIVATGHFRNGVLLAPATASAVIQLVETGSAREIEPFAPGRFARDAA